MFSLWIIRKRRGKKEEAIASNQNTGQDEGNNDAQPYFQQKGELDDEQRIHEMDAVEPRYEMEGDDRIHEIPVEERHRRSLRQELRGEEHARELSTSQVHALDDPDSFL